MTIAMKDLQAKVNEIAKGLGGIDTPPKLREAQKLARQDAEIQGLMLEILDEALVRKYNADTDASIRRFLGMARG